MLYQPAGRLNKRQIPPGVSLKYIYNTNEFTDYTFYDFEIFGMKVKEYETGINATSFRNVQILRL